MSLIKESLSCQPLLTHFVLSLSRTNLVVIKYTADNQLYFASAFINGCPTNDGNNNSIFHLDLAVLVLIMTELGAVDYIILWSAPAIIALFLKLKVNVT